MEHLLQSWELEGCSTLEYVPINEKKGGKIVHLFVLLFFCNFFYYFWRFYLVAFHCPQKRNYGSTMRFLALIDIVSGRQLNRSFTIKTYLLRFFFSFCFYQYRIIVFQEGLAKRSHRFEVREQVTRFVRNTVSLFVLSWRHFFKIK